MIQTNLAKLTPGERITAAAELLRRLTNTIALDGIKLREHELPNDRDKK